MNIDLYDLYVYYRVRCEHAQQLQSRVRDMQSSLSAEYGIVASLKRRPEQKDGRHTWMEVYLAAPPGFDAQLERAVAGAGLTDMIDGQRHTEFFMDCSTCV
jgi:hypothetical protein